MVQTNHIAFGSLESLERHHVLSFLRRYGSIMSCRRCKNGQVIENYGVYECLQCSAPHTPEGELVETRSGEGINLYEGTRGNR